MDRRIIGFLIIVILTSSYYIMLPDSVRVDIQETKSLFRVYENGGWVLSGIEWTNLFDGTTKMRASRRSVNSTIDGNIITILRFALYKDNITVNETYTFNANTTDPRFFPIDHKIIVTNGQGKILRYEVTDLLYTGETVKGLESPQCFGHDMKVEWDSGNYYSKIYKYLYQDKGKLTVKYRIENETAIYNVRLFDPPTDAFDKDDFFVELVDYNAGFTKGYAEFAFHNPLNKDIEISNANLKSLYTVLQGKVLSEQYSFYSDVAEKTIKTNKTTCIDNYVSDPLNLVVTTNNETGEEEVTEKIVNKPICTFEEVDKIIPAHKIKTKLNKLKITKGTNITMRIDLTYKPNTIFDWIPEIEIENIKFKQDKW